MLERLGVQEQDVPVENARDIPRSPPSMERLAYTDSVSQAIVNMSVESLNGKVTEKEIQSFISYIKTLEPKPTNAKNEWIQGRSGENLKAMALVFEIAPRIEILNKMISFCDTLLSIRNDLKGKHKIWTGRVDPVWPNKIHVKQIQTGGEQGDPVGHLAACARQILQTRDIYNKVIPGGDPHKFGKTYLERAKRYLIEADRTVDQHILKSLLVLNNDNHMYFSKRSPYKGGQPVPWNQQMMFAYGFMNLAQAHELLEDTPGRGKRIKLYDQILQSNIDWFFKDGVSQKKFSTYDWGYAMPNKTGEDCNHGSLDVAGLYRLYASGRYRRISAEQLVPIANTVTNVISLGKRRYAGRLNGTSSRTGNSAGTDRLRSGFLFTALFKPKAYQQMMAGAEIKAGGSTGRIDVYSRFLWVKHQRSQAKASAAQAGQVI